MSRAQQTFRQSDVTKALRAAAKAGMAVGRVEISKDQIVIVAATVQGADQPSAFEQWKQAHAR